MPRPVRVKSRIRDLRTIIGKTQREFALTIGISPIALNRIENNTLALSPRVARKIVVETGVAPRSLLKAKGKLRTESGEQYTAESYKKWKKSFVWQEDDELVAVEAANWLGSWIEILLRAATCGSKKRMRAVLNEIAETVDRCRVDFNLERPIDDILANPRGPFLAKDRPPLKTRLAEARALAPFVFRKWNLIRPLQKWEREAFTAKRKPRPSSRRRRKA